MKTSNGRLPLGESEAEDLARCERAIAKGLGIQAPVTKPRSCTIPLDDVATCIFSIAYHFNRENIRLLVNGLTAIVGIAEQVAPSIPAATPSTDQPKPRVRGGCKPQFDRNEIVRLAAEGMTCESIAAKLGCSIKTVYARLKTAKREQANEREAT